MSHDEPILRVEALRVALDADGRAAIVVDDFDLSLPARGVTAIVGESGSGKSMTALAIMRLLPEGVARIERGRILYGGEDLAAFSEERMRRIRGAEIAMIFQEPMTSLNPVLTIGRQVSEAVEAHRRMRTARETRARTIDLLGKVRLPDPERALRLYPHELSGGMRQRVMIAMALACDPKILLADEPTTALDATVQANILDLLKALRDEFGLAIVLITHNLGMVAEYADRVIVMYAGCKVEEARAVDLFRAAAHPYTRGLLDSRPTPRIVGQERVPLREAPGSAPAPWHLPHGCAFAPRCPLAMPVCATRPPLELIADDHRVACFAATPA